MHQASQGPAKGWSINEYYEVAARKEEGKEKPGPTQTKPGQSGPSLGWLGGGELPHDPTS